MTDPRRRLFAGACAAMFLFGIVLAILGVLFGLPEMRDRLGVTLVQQGDILLVLFLGVLLSTLIAGPMIDSLGNKLVLTTSSVFVAAGLSAFAAAHSSPAAMAGALILGFGGGGLNTSSNALVADLYPENRGAMLNVVATFYGAGALLIPLLAAAIAGIFTIPQLLLTAAALAAICAAGYLVLPFPAPTSTGGLSILASIRAIRLPGVMVLGAVLFCQSGSESAIGGWTSTYAGSIGASPNAATWILAGYWAALMFGRLISARLLAFIPKPRLILTSGIASAVGAAVLLGSDSIALLAAGAAISGIGFAAIYPTTLAIAADRYQRTAGTIFGLLFAIGLFGGMLFPWLIGHLSQSVSVRSGMIVPLA